MPIAESDARSPAALRVEDGVAVFLADVLPEPLSPNLQMARVTTDTMDAEVNTLLQLSAPHGSDPHIRVATGPAGGVLVSRGPDEIGIIFDPTGDMPEQAAAHAVVEAAPIGHDIAPGPSGWMLVYRAGQDFNSAIAVPAPPASLGPNTIRPRPLRAVPIFAVAGHDSATLFLQVDGEDARRTVYRQVHLGGDAEPEPAPIVGATGNIRSVDGDWNPAGERWVVAWAADDGVYLNDLSREGTGLDAPTRLTAEPASRVRLAVDGRGDAWVGAVLDTGTLLLLHRDAEGQVARPSHLADDVDELDVAASGGPWVVWASAGAIDLARPPIRCP